MKTYTTAPSWPPPMEGTMSKERATLPGFICDKTLADAVEEKRRELSREICAEIDTMDALHFILSDALGIDADWIANDAPAPAKCETCAWTDWRSGCGIRTRVHGSEHGQPFRFCPYCGDPIDASAILDGTEGE